MATTAPAKKESPPDKAAPKSAAAAKPDSKPGDARKGDAKGGNAKAEASNDDAQAKPGRKSRRTLILLVLLLVVAAASGGGWYYTRHGAEAKSEESAEGGAQEKAGAREKAANEDADPSKAKAGPLKPPLFVNLDPFTVNLQREEADQYLQATLVLQMTAATTQDAVKLYMPVIRNNVLLLLSSKRASQIDNTEKKQKFAEEIAEVVRNSVAAPAAEDITGVFFTSFIVQ